jgi:hypothetical protein
MGVKDVELKIAVKRSLGNLLIMMKKHILQINGSATAEFKR